jgi:hypothetical protein
MRMLGKLAALLLMLAIPGFAWPQQNPGPVVNITSPPNGTSLPAGTTLTITATATDADGVQKVEFFVGTTLIPSNPGTNPYSATYTFGAPGTFSLTAKATDTKGKATTSAAVQVQVTAVTTTVTAPVDNSVIQGRSSEVSGTFTGGDTATVIVTSDLGGHSVLASLFGANYSAMTRLSPGDNVITVQVARRDGTTDIKSIRVKAVDPAVSVFTTPNACRAYRVGDSETFTLDAAMPEGSIQQVQFKRNGVDLGPAITAPPYTATTTFSEVGTYAITARIRDSFGFDSDAPTYFVSVSTAAPVATLLSPSPGQRIPSGQAVTLTASASDADGTVSRVYYVIGNAGGETTVQGGTAASNYQAMWSPAAYGSYTVRAVAVDNGGAEGSSPAVNFVVNRPPLVSITSPANNAQFNAPASFNVIVDASDPDGGNITKVQLYRSALMVEEKTSPPYQFAVASLGAGTYQFKAKAFDNESGWTESAVVTVVVVVPPNPPPTITLTNPTSGASFMLPATITLAANASDDGAITLVEFFDGPNRIAAVGSTPYEYSWTNPGLGSHTLTAKATDDKGAVTTSGAVTISVNGTTAKITAPPTGSQFSAPASYNIVAEVATTSGTISNVEFYDGSQLIGTAAVNLPSASMSLPNTNVGAGAHVHTIKAYHSSGAVTESIAVIVQVTTPPSVSLASTSSYFIAPAAVTLMAKPSAFPAAIERVAFYSGAQLIGQATVEPYRVFWNGVAVGNHQVTAVALDSAGNQATSAPVAITVASAPVLQVAAGQDGASVDDNLVRISGSINAPANCSVLVNGVAATVDEAGNWFIDMVSLSPGTNTLTITARTSESDEVSQTITVNSTGTKSFDFSLTATEGIGPLQVTGILSERASTAIARVEFDADDDGTIDRTVTAIQDGRAEATFVYPSPGIYVMRVRAFDQDGLLLYTASRSIYVVPPSVLRNRVHHVYDAMVGSLLGGNASRALGAVSPEARDTYAAIFNSLGTDLPAAAANLGAMEVRLVGETIAQIIVLRNLNGQTLVFPVQVMKDDLGIWRISGM